MADNNSTDHRNNFVINPPGENCEENKLAQLIQAAKDADPSKIKELLLTGGVDLNGRDEEEGRTPLHWVVGLPCPCPSCAQYAEKCVSLLLHGGRTSPDVNVEDNMGLTPLHIAAESQLEKVCKMLIEYGADIYAVSKSGEVAISIIAKRTPDVILFLLNKSISLDGMFPTSERCGLSINFRTLLGNLDKRGQDPSKMSVEWNNLIDPSDTCTRYSSCRGKNELHVLRGLLRSSKLTRQKIFTHPTVAIFLDQKWRRVRKYFWTTFIAYSTWLLLYTGYILMVYLINCPNKFYNPGNNLIQEATPNSVQIINGGTKNPLNASTSWNSSSGKEILKDLAEDSKNNFNKCPPTIQLEDGSFLLLLILTIAMGVNEVAKSLVTPRLYFKSRLNALSWALVIMSLVTYYPTISGQVELTPLQYQVAALTIFLAWSLILSQVGKFPSIGIYLEIFGHVLRQFCHFLLCYASLFVAFALAFSILFPGTQPYTIFPFAMLKLFVMMVGEMEYQDVFYDEVTGRVSGPIVGHVLMVTFVIVVAIVLMNLLIGLTVSDIRTVQKEAEVCRVSRQIVDMFHMESFLFSNKIPDFIKTTLYHMTSVAVQLKRQNSGRGLIKGGTRLTHNPVQNGDSNGPLLPEKKYVFKFLPNDPRDKSVPEKLKSSAMELALKLEDEKMDKVCMRKEQQQFFQKNIFRGRGGRGGRRGGGGYSGKFTFWKRPLLNNADPDDFLGPNPKSLFFDPSSPIPFSSVYSS